ncbi:polysaccharide biosynthesis/export family protein [Plastorhodobacter daqingensis]|uniref:Polysaccharide biosynthesis/export family protein n=1 Tax=Plastorhodobacter daqingensis TaxID=1387281 RepID=A0ABW2UL48_9RHOB
MKQSASRGVKLVALLATTAIVAGCALPRSGPTRSEILAGAEQTVGAPFIVAVDDRIARTTSVEPKLTFPAAFRNIGLLGPDTINAGDTLGLTIYENVNDGLLAGTGQNMAVLETVQVDGQGFIFVPYAGRIRAAGNTPEALRQLITAQLETQTPDPQVQVRRIAGDGAAVAIMGDVGGQGVYPIERPTRTLAGMLARAGGISTEPETALVTVIRGATEGTAWLNDLYTDPSLDIPLRDGDRIVVKQDERTFVALGATGGQARVPFGKPEVTALDAIAQAGGLNTNLADPKGIFVMRNERAEIANAVLGRSDLVGDQRMVYVLDLTQPNGMFFAREFLIRDRDTVYVTQAPYVQWQKTLSALTGPLSTANTVNNTLN